MRNNETKLCLHINNEYRTTFYIGVTGDLNKRIIQHIKGEGSKFTSKYNITDLIYFEAYSDINEAIRIEKQLKNWRHEWKVNLIMN